MTGNTVYYTNYVNLKNLDLKEHLQLARFKNNFPLENCN